MNPTTPHEAQRTANWERFLRLLHSTVPGNRFYAAKFQAAGITPAEIVEPSDFTKLPFTLKEELTADQVAHPPYGTTLTYPIGRYTRLHQTSGTSTGRPLRWLDTAESWEALLNCWRIGFQLMGLTERDRVFLPFSFGPFLGFWSAFEAAARAGMFVVPGGGMTSTARLRFLIEHEISVVFVTPTYALHLAELAAKEGIDLAGSSVRALVVAGEPGGNIPATRQRIETLWGARIFDHYGMTEVGPVAIEADDTPGEMYLLESEYICEVVEPAGSVAVPPGEYGELVLTTLGRTGSPLFRYRTGDLVRVETKPDRAGRNWRRLSSGIRGRADDMIHIRGNNVYPGAIEAIIRRFRDVVEYRIVVDQSGSLADLRIEIEPRADCQDRELAETVARAVRDELLFRVDVASVAVGSLPRFEMKARRMVRLPSEPGPSTQ